MLHRGKLYDKIQISLQKAFSSSHGVDELAEETDETLKCHENLPEEVQQVSILLGHKFSNF